uniref:Secreted protein n=1 Tax=Ascaris lumbricoides TaxID=6252 RepID=A0A0M3HQM3_ASCLU
MLCMKWRTAVECALDAVLLANRPGWLSAWLAAWPRLIAGAHFRSASWLRAPAALQFEYGHASISRPIATLCRK